jgi:hypothetical protein
MWFTGRNLVAAPAMGITKLAKSAAWLTVATSLAFLIANASFYLLAGRFGQLPWLDYAARVTQYYPSYLGTTLVYALVGLTLAKLLKLLPALLSHHKAV